MKYSKEFENYWGNAELDLWYPVEMWQNDKIKRIAYLAFKKGKELQKKKEKR